MLTRLILAGLALLWTASPSIAAFDEHAFRPALRVKKDIYLQEGAFSGGDRLSSDVKIENVRIAANQGGFDRIVIDIAKLERPPFFMVQNNRDSRRIVATLFGKIKAEFSTQTAIQSARKTKSIKKIEFFPPMEQDRWMFAIDLQGPVKTEVFELTEPARIIIDLKP